MHGALPSGGCPGAERAATWQAWPASPGLTSLPCSGSRGLSCGSSTCPGHPQLALPCRRHCLCRGCSCPPQVGASCGELRLRIHMVGEHTPRIRSPGPGVPSPQCGLNQGTSAPIPFVICVLSLPSSWQGWTPTVEGRSRLASRACVPLGHRCGLRTPHSTCWSPFPSLLRPWGPSPGIGLAGSAPRWAASGGARRTQDLAAVLRTRLA